jgi:hypothetical protein
MLCKRNICSVPANALQSARQCHHMWIMHGSYMDTTFCHVILYHLSHPTPAMSVLSLHVNVTAIHEIKALSHMSVHHTHFVHSLHRGHCLCPRLSHLTVQRTDINVWRQPKTSRCHVDVICWGWRCQAVAMELINL